MDQSEQITNAIIRAQAAKIARLEAQLPEGMKDCVIVYLECPKGHGTLTATNWIQHPCWICEVDRLREAVADAQP